MAVLNNIYRELKGDKLIWLIIAMLALFSLLAVYSSTGSIAHNYADGNTEAYFLKHFFIILVGLGITYACHQLEYMQYSRFAPLLLFVSIVLLVYTLFFGLGNQPG